MILLRQDSRQQTEAKFQNIRLQSASFMDKKCNHGMDLSQISIYPCCYQVQCGKCVNHSCKQKESHACMLNKDQLRGFNPVSLSLLKAESNEFKRQKLSNVNQISSNSNILACSLCERTSHSQKSTQFYNCLNCKRQFCQECNKIIHGKGKFMSHQVDTIQVPSTCFNESNIFLCQTHNKPRIHLLRDNILCDVCFREQSGRYPNQEVQKLQLSLVSQNIKFSEEFFNQIYHNQANKLAQVKQNLTRLYQQSLQRLQERYKWNMTLLQRTQTSLQKNFTANIIQLSKMAAQTQIINHLSNKTPNIIDTQIISTRLEFIDQKLFQLQGRCEQLLSQLNFDYKLSSDREKVQNLTEQFLKCFNLVRVKRVEDDGTFTNRSVYRNNIKTSRTTSRISSQRLTGKSNDNRCSSFRKNQMSTNKLSSSFKDKQNSSFKDKQNSSFKDKQNSSFKDKNLLLKNITQNDSSKKIEDLNNNSMASIKKTSMTKSVNRTTSILTSNISRNGSNFFKEKEVSLNDVKDLQKAEYQDLNLNLRKLIVNKKPQQHPQSSLNLQKPSQTLLDETSLQKKHIQGQNPLRRHFLIKQNQKSATNTGSFLKIFQTSKSRVSVRKNYLVSSGEQLSSPQTQGKGRKSRVQVVTGKLQGSSPQNHSQLKKINIKNELYGSYLSSNNNFSQVETYSRVVESQSPQFMTAESRIELTQGRSNQSNENKSVSKENDPGVVGQNHRKNAVSEFDPQSGKQDRNGNVGLISSKISEFSTEQTQQLKQKTQRPKTNHMTTSVQVGSLTYNQQSHIKKVRAKPSTSKLLSKEQSQPQKPKQILTMSTLIDDNQSVLASSPILKDNTNTIKTNHKAHPEKVQKVATGQNQKMKKKPDFMDMREKMRKPNYLSTRFGNNLSHISINSKLTQGKK